MPFAKVFPAVPALDGGEVEIVLAVGAHIDVVPLAEGNDPDVNEGAVLIHGILDQDVLPVYHPLVLLYDLPRGELTLL